MGSGLIVSEGQASKTPCSSLLPWWPSVALGGKLICNGLPCSLLDEGSRRRAGVRVREWKRGEVGKYPV